MARGETGCLGLWKGDICIICARGTLKGLLCGVILPWACPLQIDRADLQSQLDFERK